MLTHVFPPRLRTDGCAVSLPSPGRGMGETDGLHRPDRLARHPRIPEWVGGVWIGGRYRLSRQYDE